MSEGWIGIIGVLLGIVVGAPVTYYFGKKLFLHQRKNDAAITFREAFIDDLIFCEMEIRENDETSIINIIEQSYPRYRKAILLYRPFIPQKSISAFDKACVKLLERDSYLNMIFSQVPGIGRENDYYGLQEGQIRKIVGSHIANVMDYAPVE